MPRSFTSVVAGGLSAVGVDMGRYLVGRDFSNPTGHFENKAFVDMNKRILTWAGGAWNRLPPREKILEFPHKDEIKDLVKNCKNEFWGWKDPRMAATVELYLPYVDDPIFIVCYRGFEETAQSIARRDRVSIVHARKIVRGYQKRISEFLERFYAGESI